MAFCLTLCTLLSGIAAGQPNTLFETASVERHIAKQLKLTRKDLRSLRPIIERENDDLLSLYGYHAEEYSSDYLSLWNAMRTRRLELENRPAAGLSPRQKRALSLARFEIVSRILEQWMDDYLQTISDLLELDWVQLNYVEKIFDAEHNKRLEVLRNEADQSVRLDVLWQKLTDDRETKLEQVLDESQLHYYHQMTSPLRLIAENL